MSTLVPGQVAPRLGTDAEEVATTRAEHSDGSDPFCILVWRFRADDAGAGAFAELCAGIAGPVDDEPKCLFRRVARSGNEFQIRAGFEDSFGVLTHVANFADTLKSARGLAELEGLSVYGTDAELGLLADPLAPFDPLFVAQDFGAAL